MQIVCSYDDYDHLEEIIQKMIFKADEYVPTMEELKKEIEPNIEEYIKFLLWIDITGIKTEENELERKEVRRLLREYFVLVENTENLDVEENYDNDLCRKTGCGNKDCSGS